MASWLRSRAQSLFNKHNLYSAIPLLDSEKDDDNDHGHDMEEGSSRAEWIAGQSNPTTRRRWGNAFGGWASRAPALALTLGANLYFLVPSFLQRSTGRARPLHPTAWLDGVRGVAAFIVIIFHLQGVFFGTGGPIYEGWRWTPPPNEDGSTTEIKRYFVQLPLIRIFFTGQAHVMLFFVVSGYALSYKPLKLIHQGRHLEMLQALASSALRRHTRLFLPAAAVLLFCVMLLYCGAYPPPEYAIPGAQGFGVPPALNPPTLYNHLWDWAVKMIALADPLGKGRRGDQPYNGAFWTLPIEFDNSLLVFLAVLAFSPLRAWLRLALTGALMHFAIYYNESNWPNFLFLGGMWLADFRFTVRGTSSSAVTVPQSTLKKAFWVCSFIFSVHLLAFPENGSASQSVGYVYLYKHVPKGYAGIPHRWWMPIGAVWLVMTLDRSPLLRPLFTNSVSQYLGKISFSIYMLHSPMLWTVMYRNAHMVRQHLQPQTAEGYFWTIMLASIPFWICTIWLADIVWRLVDAKTVDLTKWVYDRVAIDIKPAPVESKD